jgi:hypothetical protein
MIDVRLTPMVVVVAAGIAFFSAADKAAAASMLKQEPAPGALRSGERVLVDDGTCPAGQIKLVIGGHNAAGTSSGPTRKRRCVKR